MSELERGGEGQGSQLFLKIFYGGFSLVPCSRDHFLGSPVSVCLVCAYDFILGSPNLSNWDILAAAEVYFVLLFIG